jgi:hypothetical protein
MKVSLKGFSSTIVNNSDISHSISCSHRSCDFKGGKEHPFLRTERKVDGIA